MRVPLLDTFLTTFLTRTKALADPLRVDILRLLQRDSFGVLELASMLGVPQPALSHHLKLLLEAGLVTKRRDGTSIYYRRAARAPGHGLDDYTASALAVIDAVPLSGAMRGRVKKVHAERGDRSRAFFRSHAAEFGCQQALICPPEVYLGAVEELIDRACRRRRSALDVGVGEGRSLPLLARRFARMTGIDDSPQMLERAREHVAGEHLDNVSLRLSDIGKLRGRFDLVLASMVVHHSPSPGAFLQNARALLAHDAALIVVELCTHEQGWTRDACGDLWLGFEPEELDGWAEDAGLAAGESQYLAQRNGFRIQIRLYRQSTLREISRETA